MGTLKKKKGHCQPDVMLLLVLKAGSSVAWPWTPSLPAIPPSNPRQKAEASGEHRERSQIPQRLWDRNALAATLTSSLPASKYGPALSEPITLPSQVTHWGGRGGGGVCLFLASEWIRAGAELSAPVKGTASCCAGRIFLRGSLNGSITSLGCGTGRVQLCDLFCFFSYRRIPPAGFGLCCIFPPQKPQVWKEAAVAC